MTEYPEHGKMLAIRDRSQAIGEFLEDLPSKGLVLAEWVDVEGYSEPQLVSSFKSIQQVLADYFEIDLKVIEQEKRAILAEIRADNG